MSEERRVYSVSSDAVIELNNRVPTEVYSLEMDYLYPINNKVETRLYGFEIDIVVQNLPGSPKNLRQTGATSTSVTIDWEPSPHGLPPTEYQYRVGEGEEVNVPSPPLTIDGFSAIDETKIVFVRSVANGLYSQWESLEVSPTISTSLVSFRTRRTADFILDNKIVQLYMTTNRPRRATSIIVEQGIRLRLASNRKRLISAFSLERSSLTLHLSGIRRPRALYSLIKLEEINLTVSGHRRRRNSSLTLNRPAASVQINASRRRRIYVLPFIFPDQMIYANMVRRPRVVEGSMDSFHSVVSISDGVTPIQTLHSDGVWRDARIPAQE